MHLHTYPSGLSYHPKIAPSPLIGEFNDAIKYQSRWPRLSHNSAVKWYINLIDDYFMPTALRCVWCPSTSFIRCFDNTGDIEIYMMMNCCWWCDNHSIIFYLSSQQRLNPTSPKTTAEKLSKQYDCNDDDDNDDGDDNSVVMIVMMIIVLWW